MSSIAIQTDSRVGTLAYPSNTSDEPASIDGVLHIHSDRSHDSMITRHFIDDSPRKARDRSKRTSRRFVGFVIEFGADQASVLLQEGTTYQKDSPQFEYAFPSSYLRKYAISLPNQPFEMTEIETEGEVGKTYVFKSLAAPEDFRREQLTIGARIDSLAARKRANL